MMKTGGVMWPSNAVPDRLRAMQSTTAGGQGSVSSLLRHARSISSSFACTSGREWDSDASYTSLNNIVDNPGAKKLVG